MKWNGLETIRIEFTSRPARGGWIEMAIVSAVTHGGKTSRPARGGWIEMDNAERHDADALVPPRTGRVD